MKRRSARPFTVEVKHTRTSRVALVDTTTRHRDTPDLWWDIPPVAADKPAEAAFAPAAPVEPAPSETPARRVLPSLVPMFATEPDADDADDAPSAERLPRVRRAKAASKPAPKAASKRAQTPVVAVAPPVFAAAPKPAPVAVASQPAMAEPAAMPGRTIRLSRQADTLKAGERWKRRLPRHLW